MKMKNLVATAFLAATVISHVPAQVKEACLVFAEQAQILTEMRDRGVPGLAAGDILFAAMDEKNMSRSVHAIYIQMLDFV